MKIKQMNFEIGETVVCVRGAISLDGIKLIEGQEYTIEMIGRCAKCGTPYLWVGLPSDNRNNECHGCPALDGQVGKWTHNPNRFAKKKEYQKSSEIVAELLEEITVSNAL